MTVQLIDVSGCKRNLVGEIPASVVNEEIDRLALKYAKKAKVPGFRPGKAPLSIIKQRFADDLRSDATHDLIQRYWKGAIEEHQLKPLAEPVLENVDSSPGRPVKFTVSFEILPTLEITNYSGLPCRIEEPAVSNEDVAKVLVDLREQNAEYVPMEEGEIRDGYLVNLTVNGNFEDGGRPIHEEDVLCVVGDPHTNETFSENLRGAKLGDSRAFEVSYPADYHRQRFAGKRVQYRVLVKEVKEKHLPEVNDDFAKDHFGRETLEDLRTKIREDLITKNRAQAEKKAREQLLERVVGSHSFDIPECLIRDELHEHAQRIAADLARQGIDVNKVSIDWQKIFEKERPQAVQTVRQMLVLEAIARQEKLEATDDEIEMEVRRLAEGAKKSVAAIRAQLEKDQRIQSFKQHLRQKKALDFMFRNANISRG